MNAKSLKVAALIPVGLMSLVLLMFGIGESVGGDWSGLGHLVPVLFAGLVCWLGWKQPLWGGALLLVGAVMNAIPFLPALSSPQDFTAPFVIMILPLLLSGGLMLWAGLVERGKAKPPSPDHQPGSQQSQ